MIKTLGERVEREHGQYLRISQMIEDRSSGFDGHGSSNGVPKLGGTVNFETLFEWFGSFYDDRRAWSS